MHAVNGIIYFEAVVGNTQQIWRSDGTKDGTIMIKEGVRINSELIFNKGNVYFEGNDSKNDLGLWKSDGTPDGTVMIKKVNLTCFSLYITQFKNEIFYVERNQYSAELWKSDGTKKGTSLVISFNNWKGIQRLFRFKNKLFFSGKDWNHGAELWQTDGTTNGTHLLKDIKADSIGSSPRNLYTNDSVHYFSAYDPERGRELWTSDGTIDGTHIVKDIRAGGKSGLENDCDWKSLFNEGTLYFLANDGLHGQELWRSDGSMKGTSMVQDILPGRISFLPMQTIQSSKNVEKAGNQKKSRSHFYKFPISESFPFYFLGYDGEHGYELWRSDGSKKGTYMVKDIFIGPKTSMVKGLVEQNGIFYFFADDGIHGYEIWKSDGTEKGTQMLKDLAPGKKGIYIGASKLIENDLYLFIYDLSEVKEARINLWKLNTIDDKLHFITSICNGASCSDTSISNLRNANGTLFYELTEEDELCFYSWELWSCDGTEKGPVQLFRYSSDNHFPMIAMGDEMWFLKHNNKSELALWRSDGTKEGTMIFQNIDAEMNTQESISSEFFEINGAIHFSAEKRSFIDGKYYLNWTLWRINNAQGKAVQTVSLKIPDVSQSFYETPNVISGDTLYLGVHKPLLKEVALWKSDGTNNGTIMVKRLKTQMDSYPFYGIPRGNGEIFFNLNTHGAGRELWRSNGTENGTFRITGEDLNLGK